MRPFFESFPATSARLALAPVFPDYVEDVVLAADSLIRVRIPDGAAFVLFSFDADLRVKFGTDTAIFALPVAGTSDGSGSELNPAARRIPKAQDTGTTTPTHVLLRAPVACKGSLSFYG